jgi:hypothetical protein
LGDFVSVFAGWEKLAVSDYESRTAKINRSPFLLPIPSLSSLSRLLVIKLPPLKTDEIDTFTSHSRHTFPIPAVCYKLLSRIHLTSFPCLRPRFFLPKEYRIFSLILKYQDSILLFPWKNLEKKTTKCE